MTAALCLNCGEMKFGALVPCPCQFNLVDFEQLTSAEDLLGNQDANLAIAFSDHHYDKQTLQEFGAVIKAINERCPDRQLAHTAFLAYVTWNFPEILKVEFDSQLHRRCLELLTPITLPSVTLRQPAH